MPLRRPQNLELEQSNGATSLYPAVPVMRGGTFGAHSPMSAPRSPMLGPSPVHRAATPLGHAYSPAPKSGSMGSVGSHGAISVGSPHVHWADFAFVREVSNIFDRQMQLGLPPHTPEAVENPFRRRTQRQFYMDGETPPAMSASAGTLFTMAPVPQEHIQAAPLQHNNNAMFAGMFAGMGTPVTERSVSPSNPQYQQQQPQQQHFGVTNTAYASGGASRAATARPLAQAPQPARVRPSTPGVPPGRSGGPAIVQAHGQQHPQHQQYQQQYQQQQAQQQQQQAQAQQLGGAYTASRRTAPRNSISAPSGQAYAYVQQTPTSQSSAGHAYGRSNSSWM